jgi:hypothetical protein
VVTPSFPPSLGEQKVNKPKNILIAADRKIDLAVTPAMADAINEIAQSEAATMSGWIKALIVDELRFRGYTLTPARARA